MSFEHKKNDVLAVEAFRDFEAEVHSWKWKGGLSEPPHRLGAFADYLSERWGGRGTNFASPFLSLLPPPPACRRDRYTKGRQHVNA